MKVKKFQGSCCYISRYCLVYLFIITGEYLAEITILI